MSENLHDEESQLGEEEYMHSPVPHSARRPTWKQVMVWIGFGYVATGFVVGGQLAGVNNQPGLPPLTALTAIFTGMGVLFVLTILLGIIAQRTGLNLAQIARYSYGSVGVVLPLAIMSILTIGWFASITGMITEVWDIIIGNPTNVIVYDPAIFGFTNISPITLEVLLATIFFGLLFTITVYFGITAIESVATIISPLILLVAVFAGVGMLIDGGGVAAIFTQGSKIEGLGFGTALNIITGSWIAGVIMGTDFFRFNKNIKGVVAGAFACFLLTNPLLNIVGYIAVISTGSYNFVNWMAGYGIVLGLVGAISWTAALWTTNNAELYANAQYTGPILSTFKVKVRRKKIVLIVGIIGTLISALGFYQLFFVDFMNVMGAAFLPLAGPIIADYYFIKKQKYNLNKTNSQPKYRKAGLISFIIGALIGIIFEFFIPIGLPAGILGLVVSTILYPLLHRLMDYDYDQPDSESQSTS